MFRTLGRPIRIYCDNAQVADNLTRPDFVHVASAAEADVVWVGAWLGRSLYRRAAPRRLCFFDSSLIHSSLIQLYHSTMTASFRAEQGLRPDVVLNQALGDECLVFKV